MNPSQNTSLPAGLELPVLTDVVEEATLPVLIEEPPFELPDFDFSSELDEMATLLPTESGAMELEIPVGLSLDAVPDVGPAPTAVEPVVDFSNLPSLDLEATTLDELALDDVLPGLMGGASSSPPNDWPAAGAKLGDESFDLVSAPTAAAADILASVSSEPSLEHGDGFAIPELTVEWLEPSSVNGEQEAGTASPWPGPVELASGGSIPVLTEGDSGASEAVTHLTGFERGEEPVLDVTLGDELAVPEAGIRSGMPDWESDPVVDPLVGWAKSMDEEAFSARETTLSAPVPQSIDIGSLPTGVLGGGIGPEPVDLSSWGATTYASTVDALTVAGASALSEPEVPFSPIPLVTGRPVVEESVQPASGDEVQRLADEERGHGELADGESLEMPEAVVVAEGLQSAVSVESPAGLVPAVGFVDGEGTSDDLGLPVLLEEMVPAVEACEPDDMSAGEPSASGVNLAAVSRESDVLSSGNVASGEGEGAVAASSGAVDGVEPCDQAAAVKGEGAMAAAVPPPQDAEAVTDLAGELLESAAPAIDMVATGTDGEARSCAVVDEQALIDSLTQKILPRMKVELSLWLQDALEMQARQMLSGVMHQLKEDYEMLFNETLRESLRQAITEIGRDEREGKS